MTSLCTSKLLTTTLLCSKTTAQFPKRKTKQEVSGISKLSPSQLSISIKYLYNSFITLSLGESI